MPNNIKHSRQPTKDLSWEDIRIRSVGVALWVKNNMSHKGLSVYGIPRGGVIPATIVTYLLENAGIEARFVQSIYDLTPNDFRNLIVIDDICDSGDTFKVLKQLAPTAKTATLYHRSDAGFTPDYFDEEIVTTHWLSFPWESRRENQD